MCCSCCQKFHTVTQRYGCHSNPSFHGQVGLVAMETTQSTAHGQCKSSDPLQNLQGQDLRDALTLSMYCSGLYYTVQVYNIDLYFFRDIAVYITGTVCLKFQGLWPILIPVNRFYHASFCINKLSTYFYIPFNSVMNLFFLRIYLLGMLKYFSYWPICRPRSTF